MTSSRTTRAPRALPVLALVGLLVAPSASTGQTLPATGGAYAGSRIATLASGYVDAADMDQDGVTDLVLAGFEGTWIFLGLGDGRVEGYEHPAAATGSVLALDTLDWNGDGFPDAALIQGGLLHTLLGDGAGGSLGVPTVATGVGSNLGILAADMDDDGHADLVLAHGNPDEVRVILGDGAGGVAATHTGAALDAVFEVAVDDLDVDGDLDVVGSIGDGVAGFIATWFGDGSGALVPGGVLATPATVHALATGDLDTDGAPEVATSPGFGNDVRVHPNLGNGVLGPPVILAVASPDQLRFEDLDGDTQLDLLVPSRTGNEILLFRGDGTGALSPPESLAVGNAPFDLELLHLDGDGLLDLAVICGGFSGLSFHTGVGTGALRLPPQQVLDGALQGLAVADLDGDGHFEAITTADAGHRVWILEGTGTEAFGAATSVPAGGPPSGVAVGDVTADGHPDVLVPLFQLGGGFSLLANDGTGGLLPAAFHPTGNNTTAVALADMDEEGSLDVLTLDRASNKLSLLLADGLGGLGAPDSWPVATQPNDLSVGDLDGDAVPDVVVVSDGSTEMTVLLGRGGGSGDLDLGTPVDVGPAIWAVDLGDVDLDGDLDAVMVTPNADRTKVFANDGAAGFAQAHNLAATIGPIDVAVADVDLDGAPDLVTGGVGGIGVHRGRDLVGFWPVHEHHAVDGSASTLDRLALVDLEGSGFPDVVTVSYSSRVSVIPNLGSPWWRLGGGAAGGPVLSPVGALTPGSALVLDAWNGPASGLLWIVLGLSLENAPFGAGTLVPSPEILLPLPLEADGTLHVSFDWPPGLPPGIPLWLQPWLASPHTPGDALLGVTR